MQICQQVQKLLINQSGYHRFPFWETGLRKFVLHTLVLQQLQFHTTVLQQLRFKMPETVIKHHIWPLNIMFSNRKMPEAPDLDENRKSIFLTCISKILTLCIVTKHQCDSHWYFSWNFDFYTLVKSIHFPFKWYQNYANLPTGSKVIDKSIWLPYRVPFWEIGLRKFVSHTTVFKQLQI